MQIIPLWCQVELPPELDPAAPVEVPSVMLPKAQLPFPAATEYWMPQGPIGHSNLEWAMTWQGDGIRVPLSAYSLPGGTTLDAWGGGVAIGLDAYASWLQQIQASRPRPPKPRAVLLIMGTQVPQPAQGQRQLLGLVIVVERPPR